MTTRYLLKNIALPVLVGSVGLASCNRQDENQESEEILRPVRTNLTIEEYKSLL